MKRLFRLLFITIHAIQAPLVAVIIETQHFENITNYTDSTTLVILDIDDTILIPTQTLGTDVWFRARIQEHKENGKSSQEALQQTVFDWEAVRKLSDVCLVEANIPTIIANMQNQGIAVIGLTTQGYSLARRTHHQLLNLDINLELTAPSKENYYFIQNNHGVLYSQGVLFTGGTNKGTALLTLLNQISHFPKKIIFINDKETHIKEVESTLEGTAIEFIGLRYSYSDERISNYRQEIADIQWKHSTFERILSDEEAEKIIRQIQHNNNN